MKNRIISAFAVLLLLAAMFPASAFAASADNCKITVNCSYSGKPIENAKVNIYRIAEISADGKVTLSGAFSGYRVIVDPSSADTLRTAAKTLDAYAKADNISPDKSAVSNSVGAAKLSGLSVGVYLVSIERMNNGDNSRYDFEPFIAFLPYAESEVSEPAYAVLAYPKAIQRTISPEKKTYIHVVKVWDDKDFIAARPLSATVRLICDGQTYDTVKLNAANNWRFTWEDLDADHVWTVAEDNVDRKYVVALDEPEEYNFVLTNTRVEKICIPIIPIIPVHGIIVPIIVVTAAIITPIVVKEIIDHTKPETTKPEEPEEELPNTGALWWPVPILACAGFTFILCGTKMRKKHEEE